MTEPAPKYDTSRPAGHFGEQMTTERERAFWVGLRKALIELIRAIEVRYGLESALINNAQRKALKRIGFERQDEAG